MSGVGNLSGGFFFPDLINDAVPERNAGPSLVYSLGSGVGEGAERGWQYRERR